MAKRNQVIEQETEEFTVTDQSENLDFDKEEVVEEPEFKESDFVTIKESEALQAKGKTVVEIKEFNGVTKHRLV